MNDFLPQGYEPPKATGKYTRFEDGKTTRVRVMCSPVIGWEYWDKVTTNKPVRLPYNEESYKFAVSEAKKNPDQSKDGKVSHFWAMVVWNYDSKQLEIMQITQKTIQSSIRNYAADEEYGSPINYDLKITKKKDGDKTNYEIMTGVPKAAPDEALSEFAKWDINLRALFLCKDPFDTTWVEEFE